ncbi:MAG: penicillin acylase family protein, partial [Steroidobacteraceae bacterium]
LALRASLPDIDGEVHLAGLSAPASIERDAAGVPVMRGATREDVARATGYAHAQDRWFQMDLLRRTSAGELSELLGPALLDTDRRIRLHQFRQRAEQALADLDPVGRGLLEAYAAGVNAATADSRMRPFEYLLLREEPAPWRAEDTLLVVYAMWIDLQGLEDRSEQQNGLLAASVPASLYRLLVEGDPEWEAPLDGSLLPQAPLPDAEEIDLRRLDPALFAEKTASVSKRDPDAMVGSNNWAVAGGRTASGRALVANDMHLGLRVPNIWYRARLVVESAQLDVSGVSLPGVPAIIAGSNGRVAWGFTNSYGDFQDLVALVPAADKDSYLTADGPRHIETDIEVLHVAGGADERLPVRRTVWGPIVAKGADGRELALSWTADRPEATDMALLGLERAQNIDEAAASIGGAGMPAQNVMIGDSGGRIGWVLSGRLPRRHGFDPKRPADWSGKDAGWDGWIAANESPRLLDPPDGRVWSANARVVGGEMLAKIGDGGYAPATRARQIRDRLAAIQAATPKDLLAIQLDDRADYLAHWQPILLHALAQAGATEAKGLVARWSGHAEIDDPGYRLLREFEEAASDRAYQMLTAEARKRWPDFRWRTPPRFTEVALRLIHERPANLLDPRFADWDAWLADVANQVVKKLPDGCTDLASCNWGTVNRTRIRHPLSQALPLLSRWLDLASEPMPGDWSMPRVQSPTFGASERFAVSPGLESEGYLHMPGGQSGHPLSPYYRAGHEAWVRGEATPFLPGVPEHVLKLMPGEK